MSDDDTELSPQSDDETEAGLTQAGYAGPLAWSEATSSQPVVDYYAPPRWRGLLPKVLVGVTASLAIAAGVVLLASGHHEPAPAPPKGAPTVQQPPSPAPTTPQLAARMDGHNLQLQGTPEQWDAVTAELAKQGVDVTISPVGVITKLEFANYDKAPDDWVRWYAKHVPQDPHPIKEGGPISMLVAYEHGLPVPPPPAICYTNDGTPVATAAFDPAIYGSYAEHCGPTPGALAGH